MFIPSKSGAVGFLVILGWSDDQNLYWPCVYCTRIYFSLRIHRWWLKFLHEHHSFQGSKTWSRSISSRFEIWQKRPHPGYFNGFKRVVKNDEHFRPIFVIKSSLTVFKPFQRHHKDSVSESWQLKPPLLVAFLSMLWRTAKHRTTLPGYIFGLDFAHGEIYLRSFVFFPEWAVVGCTGIPTHTQVIFSSTPLEHIPNAFTKRL